MASLLRKAGAAAAVALLVAGVVATAGFFYLKRSIQPRSGEFELPGLSRPVAVAFDEWAIPRIHAATEADALRAQGFLHASERLWQLELFQRVARGRLAEIFGEPAAGFDQLMRTLDIWSVAGQELEEMAGPDRALLEAYADGVDARMASWRGQWPPEFLILGIEPQPWSPQASLAIGRIMSLDLSEWQTELSRISAAALLGGEHLKTLRAGYPAWGPTILQDTLPAAAPPPRIADNAAGSAGRVALRAAAPSDPGSPLAFLSSFGFRASNSWALGGARTASGHPLIANDIHLALRAPSTWYLVAMAADERDHAVAGLSIPGVPGVVVGLNRNLAWTFTNAGVDDADFVAESVNLDRSMYRRGDAWQPFESRAEEVVVRGRDEPVALNVRSTVRGPVITDVMPAGGLTLSLLWTGLESGGAAAAILAMNRSKDAATLVEAVKLMRSPHQNVIYATTSGEIGYRMGGSVPERRDGEGAFPLSFEAMAAGWPGMWPEEAMPALANPERGYLASANNLQAWPHFGAIGVDYPVPFRARRVDDLVSRASGWGVEEMRTMQLDSYSLWAERHRPRAVQAARRAGLDSLAAILERWDLRTETDRFGPAPFFIWLYRLRELLAADEYDGGDGWFPDVALIEVMEDEGNIWVDDRRTPRMERLESLEEEAARHAALVADRRWGEVHQERSFHPLGEVAFLDRIFRFNIGPYPARGGPHTIRPDDPDLRARIDSAGRALPMVSQHGPTARFVARLAPGDAWGAFLLPTGQAGNPLDPHYRDMAPVWSESPLIRIEPGERLARPAASLRLLPKHAPAETGNRESR